MKKAKVIVILWLIVALYSMTSLASAEIFLGQTSDLYNLGDELNMNASLIEKSNINGFFSAVLTCSQGEIELYRAPQSVQGGQQKVVSFSAKFDRAIIGNMSGVCSINVRYSGEEKQSSSFEITSNANVQANIDKAVYSPLERVLITGSAYKKNGKQMQGFAEARANNIDAGASGLINKGLFNLSFIIPEHAASRNYIVKIRAYETDYNNELTNEGNTEMSIKVRQVPSRLDIALDSTNVSPGKDFLYMIILKDQSEEDIKTDVSTAIRHPDSTVAEKRLVHTGESNIFNLDKNATPGNWIVEAELVGLKSSKSWYVEEFENVSYTILNGTLTILNTGNVRYNKPIEITIGGVKEIKNMDLSVGGSKKFKIYAPDGSYDLEITDGKSSIALGKNYLTGNSISIADFENMGSRFSSIAAWVIISALAVVAFIYGRTAIKKRFYGNIPRELSVIKEDHAEKFGSLSKYKTYDTEVNSSAYASRSGKKEECGVIFLNIRNLENIRQDEQTSSILERIVRIARESKSFAKEDEKGFIFIFSPARTKEKDNLIHSIRFARKIEQILQDYNKKNALNINFGIGAHVGEIIVENSAGKYDFYAVGSTIIIAKRAAEKAMGEILISGPAHRKTAIVVKTEMVEGENLWKVRSIIDREEHKEFLDRFMKKNR